MRGIPMHQFDPTRWGIELVYFLVVFMLCFFIYFKTREIYELTQKKSIFYFRNTFLFFSLSFLIRFIFVLFRYTEELRTTMKLINPYTLFIMGYLSTMAIISLLLSVLWKNSKFKFWQINIFVLIFSIAIFITRSFEFMLLAQIIIIIASLFFGFRLKKKSKKIFSLYYLIFASWFVNMYVVSLPKFIDNTVRIPLYGISIILFSIIYYKVNKWIK